MDCAEEGLGYSPVSRTVASDRAAAQNFFTSNYAMVLQGTKG